MRHEWADRTGDIGSLFTDGNNICLRLSEDPNEDEDDDADPVSVAHWLPIPTARALHEALGRALAEVDPNLTPSHYEYDDGNPECSQDDYEAMTYAVTDSISATLATCSTTVLDIIRVHPTGAGDHGSIDITTGDGLTRYAVQQVLGKSLRDVTAGELAKLGLKPSQPEPRGTPATPEERARSLGLKSEPVKFDCAWFDRYLLECGHHSPYKNSCVTCAKDITTASQKPSQPEPPPTGNGELEPPSS